MKKNDFPDIWALYAKLKPFYRKIKKGRAHQDLFFENCLRASFAKVYELNVMATNRTHTVPAFFLTPALRSVCEDLILLRYLGSLKMAKRNRVIGLLMKHELLTNLQIQESFFAENRPFQLVLKTPDDYESDLANTIAELQAFWKRQGWTLNGKIILPQIRQLAERRGILTLYDFIYRLTCDVVHFNPQVLLRSGWGALPDVEFSTKNFELYYRAFAVIYGSFLFCIYFELFASFLRPDANAMQIVRNIREYIQRINRWPEIVTFEEMNLKPPGSPFLHVLRRVIFEQSSQGRRKYLLRRQRHPRATNNAQRMSQPDGSSTALAGLK